MTLDEPQTAVARTGAERTLHNTLVIRRDAKIAFVLHSEAELSVYKQREFVVERPGFRLTGQTDDAGTFEHGPVVGGEYELVVGRGRFTLPTVAPDAPPHPVHLPNVCLPDIHDEWLSPAPEELADQG